MTNVKKTGCKLAALICLFLASMSSVFGQNGIRQLNEAIRSGDVLLRCSIEG
ncbi:MAG: hypothetical protein FWG89_06080 [Treponema sp.]|nr:hypothetical protein [Treponema sp.]